MKEKLNLYWTEEKGRIYKNGSHPITLIEARQNMARGKYGCAKFNWKGSIPCNFHKEFFGEMQDWNERISRGCKNTSLPRCDKFCPMHCEQ
jgi:hypothetical protein